MEDLGLREWYNPTPPTGPEVVRVSWAGILDAWTAIECDLQDQGIDVESGILHQRTWRWLNTRILDLIDRPSRLRTALNLTNETTRKK